jgi:hypothetical protein
MEKEVKYETCLHDDCFTCPYSDCIAQDPYKNALETDLATQSEEERKGKNRERTKQRRREASAERKRQKDAELDRILNSFLAEVRKQKAAN